MNICGDNRFELIERYKKQLVESTNIERSPDEMAVIDNILFRFWQMGWLKEQEAKPMTEYDDGWDCPRCGLKLVGKTASGYPCDELDLPNDEIVKYCPVCGQAVKWDG